MTSRDESWPALDIAVVRVPASAIYSHCHKAIPLWQQVVFGVLPFACAEIHKAEGFCIAWVSEDASDWIVNHEVAHCKGYDHI